MFGIDERIAELGSNGSVLTLMLIAVLLGLRHASDPDHLAAVSALIAGDEAAGARRAGRLGLAWGAGHAITIAICGVPIVVMDAFLPEPVQVGAETLVGVLIMVLALRLLTRWRRGRVHTHSHAHGDRRHTHLHGHGRRAASGHGHDSAGRRSMRGSFAIGLVHGIGGSAGIGILLLAAIPDHGVGVAALGLFALFTAASMGVTSSLLGRVLAGRPQSTRPQIATPALGMFNLAFGAWYALGALGAVPYVF